MSMLTPGDRRRQAAKRCRSCGAPIIWCVTESGRKMPVDFAPTPSGNVAIRPADGGWEAIVAGPLEPVDGCTSIRRTSHFATCPDAQKHRRSS
jgi:hypothetical protein